MIRYIWVRLVLKESVRDLVRVDTFFLSSFSGVGHFLLERVIVFISFSSAPLEDYDKKVILFVV